MAFSFMENKTSYETNHDDSNSANVKSRANVFKNLRLVKKGAFKNGYKGRSRLPVLPWPGLMSQQVTAAEELSDTCTPLPKESSILKHNSPNSIPDDTPIKRRAKKRTAYSTPTIPLVVRPAWRKQQKWHNHENQSMGSLAELIQPPEGVKTSRATSRTQRQVRKNHTEKPIISGTNDFGSRNPIAEGEIRITIQITEFLIRQKYLVKLCRALMAYGAPTHRLEECMRVSARVLEIESQFLYVPGCMIMSFDDLSTSTTEVKLVKLPQGVNLGKMKDVHSIYKDVLHDVISIEEANRRLDAITKAELKYNKWFLVFVYGLASASVAPFGKSCFAIYILIYN
jgi:hypothetical protein